jgi:ATP-dependent Clp protease ATP-binding subunit ClpB
MTSNIGSDVIRERFENVSENNMDTVADQTKDLVFDLLKRTVRPEFLNRIDEVIMFRPLSRKDIANILNIQLGEVKELLAKQDIALEFSPHALQWLSSQGFDPEFGARPLKRIIKKKVLHELSKQLLTNSIKSKSKILMDVFDDTVVFREVV